MFLLTTYSLGLRLGEALALEVGDVDAEAERIPVREAKGGKDRFVPLPVWTLVQLRKLWRHHRHPRLLFPNPRGNIAEASTAMDRGGVQHTPSKPLWPTTTCIANFASTACSTPTPLTCWRPAWICARSKPCSAITARPTARYTQLTQRTRASTRACLEQLMQSLPHQWRALP